MNHIPPPQPEDVIAWITVRCHADGAVSIAGTIGDATFARRLLDHARDAITRQVPDRGIVVPNRDVELAPSATLKELGDIPIAQRGDP